MQVDELRPGLWRWTALHPDWTPEEGGPDGWEQEVSSYMYEAPDALVVFDPLAPEDGTEAERFWTAFDRDVERHGPPHVLLTIFWHARSAQALLDRYEGTRVWAHEPAAEELRKRVAVTDTFAAGAELPGPVEAKESVRGSEILFWIPQHRALVAGDVLLGTSDGGIRVCPDSWLGERTNPRELRDELRPLLDLPLELVLLTHGEPVVENAREALAQALAR